MAFTNIKCPRCGAAYFTVRYSTRTAMFYPPIYKDGVNINPDRNITTNVCQCLKCNECFSFREQNGKILDF